VNLKIKYRLWIEIDSKPLIGSGGLKLLQLIDKHKSIKAASKEIGVSYAFAWRYIKKLENVLNTPLVKRWRGGKEHGGAELTELGREIIKIMNSLNQEISDIINKYEDKLKTILKYNEL